MLRKDGFEILQEGIQAFEPGKEVDGDAEPQFYVVARKVDEEGTGI